MMRNLKFFTISIVLGGVILLSACGTSEKASSTNSSDNTSTTSQTAAPATNKTSDDKGLITIVEGTKKMKNIMVDFIIQS